MAKDHFVLQLIHCSIFCDIETVWNGRRGRELGHVFLSLDTSHVCTEHSLSWKLTSFPHPSEHSAKAPHIWLSLCFSNYRLRFWATGITLVPKHISSLLELYCSIQDFIYWFTLNFFVCANNFPVRIVYTGTGNFIHWEEIRSNQFLDIT